MRPARVRSTALTLIGALPPGPVGSEAQGVREPIGASGNRSLDGSLLLASGHKPHPLR